MAYCIKLVPDLYWHNGSEMLTGTENNYINFHHSFFYSSWFNFYDIPNQILGEHFAWIPEGMLERSDVSARSHLVSVTIYVHIYILFIWWAMNIAFEQWITCFIYSEFP